MDFHITRQDFVIDGKTEPLLSAEIHYFRMAREAWSIALDHVVEAGCNAVAFYIPWFVHEYEDGVFDFAGKQRAETDLHAFIQLASERKLWILFRPGPYIYAESTDLGIPRWFSQRYPQTHPLTYKDGQYQPYGMKYYASHNHPAFLNRVQLWLEAVMAEIRPYLAPKGSIVMIQLCNEIPGEDHRDENPETLGLGDPEGLWPQFLKARYGTEAALCRAYGISDLLFKNCPPHLLRESDEERFQRDHLAYYYEYYYPTYFSRLKAMLGELPPEVYLFHNAYNPKALSLHYQNQKQNPWLVMGVDCYYSMTGALDLASATYFNDFGARYSQAMFQNPPWVVEQECGYWHDFPTVYGSELYIWNLWSVAAGYKGLNLYLFAAGENIPGMGFFGSSHNWQAPLKQDGYPATNYPSVKKSLLEIRDNFALLTKAAAYDMILVLPEQAGLIWTSKANVVKDTFFLLRAMNLSPKIILADQLALENLKGNVPIWVVGGRELNRQAQTILAELVGHCPLIVSGMVPYLDQEGEPCNILAEAMAVKPEVFTWTAIEQQKILWQGKEVFIGQRVQPLGAAEDSVLAYVAETNQPAVWLTPQKVLIMPFPLEMIFWQLGEMVLDFLRLLAIKPLVEGARLLRVFPKSDGSALVFNLHPQSITETVTIFQHTQTLTLKPYSYIYLEDEHDRRTLAN